MVHLGLSDLPPLPAMVQQQLDSGISFPRRSSNMTVAERLALQFDVQPTIDDISDPYGDTVADIPSQMDQVEGRPAWLQYAAIASVVLLIVGIMGGIGWQTYSNNNASTATPAIAVIVTEEPLETEVVVVAVEETATSTATPNSYDLRRPRSRHHLQLRR